MSGNEYYIMMHGDPTMTIPTGDDMMEVAARLYEDPEGIIAEEEIARKYMVEFAEKRSYFKDGEI